MRFSWLVSRVLGIATLLALWQLISFVSGEFFFPSLTTVVKILFDLIISGDFIGPISITLARVTFGMILAVTFGVFIGIITGSRHIIDNLIGPILIVVMLTPSLLMVFLTIFTLGFYDYVPSFAAAIVHTPFSAIVIRGQLLNPPKEKLEMAKAYCASKRLILWHIYLPFLVPVIMSEARVAYGHSWKITILSEIFGFSSGAGYMVKIYFANLDIARVLTWASLVIVFVLCIEEVLRMVEKRMYRWSVSGG